MLTRNIRHTIYSICLIKSFSLARYDNKRKEKYQIETSWNEYRTRGSARGDAFAVKIEARTLDRDHVIPTTAHNRDYLQNKYT